MDDDFSYPHLDPDELNDLHVDSLEKQLFDMVYQWGRVGVVVDYTCPAYQDVLQKVKTLQELPF